MDFFFRLPMPWLLYTLVFGKPVPVTSAGMVCSITLLFCMLMLVFFSILSFNWKMTKGKNLKTSNPPHKIILKNYLGKRPVQQFWIPCVFKYETQFYHFFIFLNFFNLPGEQVEIKPYKLYSQKRNLHLLLQTSLMPPLTLTYLT